MISNLNSRNQLFLDGLSNIEQRLSRAQQQVTSGFKVATVSDAPDQISTLLQTRADLARTQTVQTNLGRVKTEVDTGEQAISSAVSLLENVRTLGTQASTFTSTADARTSIASEVNSALQQLVGISSTSVEGRYIFSGNSDQTPPYTIDSTQSSGVSGYAGSAATRQAEHPNGTRFDVAKTAQDIFDSPDASNNVFFAVNSLHTALLANDQTGITNAVNNISSSLTYLNGQLAFYGTAQNKVAEATDTSQTMVTNLKTQLGSIQDADMTQSIIDLQQAQLAQQAALQTQGSMPRKTLFDYLA